VLDTDPTGKGWAEWLLFFTFLGQTGLRISEAIEVRWADVDGSWLRVNRRYYRGRIGLPKGRKKRSVPLSRELAQALWTLRKATHAKADDLIFTSAKGKRIDPSNLMSRILKPAAVAAGLGQFVPNGRGVLIAESWVGCHTFRHTCATMLFRSGWNAVQVQIFLGHSDPGFTLRTYVHLLPGDLPEPVFPAVGGNAGGNMGATKSTETDRTATVAMAAETAA
jgi:integrase